eukprot:CAMPEP_0178440706 /NCGR_PEP_ID=MMETSP0689_2-20121128/36946_1 /TAXON_ID=160604 /ORGANISM="Amphidinium massartii, Strain CS-259" /LENGTH=182 /DNA_ID=CAMNT_0020063547 /DNA_START=34 /DNA_END=582 /DNA_ORIENTATION=+
MGLGAQAFSMRRRLSFTTRTHPHRRSAACCLIAILCCTALHALIPGAAFVSKAAVTRRAETQTHSAAAPLLAGSSASAALWLTSLPAWAARSEEFKNGPKGGFDFPIWVFPFFLVCGCVVLYLGAQEGIKSMGRIGPYWEIEEEDKQIAAKEEKARLGRLKVYTDLDRRQENLKKKGGLELE